MLNAEHCTKGAPHNFLTNILEIFLFSIETKQINDTLTSPAQISIHHALKLLNY
jgi:hypothetical protein